MLKHYGSLLGPAFVVAIAYVDPGNVAANITAGSKYGYLLIWVLILANLIAVLVQYLSAKLGIVSGRSISKIVANSANRPVRILYWLQAEIVVAATDVAEVIGGAIALNILFNIPLLLGGIIIGIFSLWLLKIQNSKGEKTFEIVIISLLAIIAVGFTFGLFFSKFDMGQLFSGMLPRFKGTDTVLLAVSMLGATVMPHAIYLHSNIVIERHGGVAGIIDRTRTKEYLTASKIDVWLSLITAGSINIAMLLLAASNLRNIENTDTINGVHAAIVNNLGPIVGFMFALGLLVSGLASTSVGSFVGSAIMKDMLKFNIPLFVRRLITLVPALILLALGFDPTFALILSQVVLSLGIPFVLVPLVFSTSNKNLMREYVNSKLIKIIAGFVTVLIILLNLLLLILIGVS